MSELIALVYVVGLALAIFIFGPRLWRLLTKRGNARERLMPAGDPMRYALASAVLKGSIFRRRIIEMASNPFLAAAPELGLNVPVLVNACKNIELADRRWQWTFFALLATAFVLPWLVLEVFSFWKLSRFVGSLALLAQMAVVGLAIYRRWCARFQDVRPFRADHYDPEAIKNRFGAADGIEAGFDPKKSNVVVFGRTNPFVGFGLPTNSWTVAIDLTRPAAVGTPIQDVSVDDVYQAVSDQIRALDIPGLEISDISFVNGTESNRIPTIQVDRYDAPSHAVHSGILRAWRDDPNAAARVYLWVRVTTSIGEVTQNYLFRCIRRGQTLLLETYQSVIPPVDKSYREVDSIRRLGFFGLIVWGLTAVALSPLTILNALVGVAGQIQEFVSNLFGGPVAREKKEIRLNPMYNYGAQETVREFIMANNYLIHFQRADGSQMNQAIDMQVLNSTRDLLKAAGVDDSALGVQSASIIQSNVTIATGGGAVSIGGNASVGSIAQRSAAAVGAGALTKRKA